MITDNYWDAIIEVYNSDVWFDSWSYKLKDHHYNEYVDDMVMGITKLL